jgi:hypothetical protein
VNGIVTAVGVDVPRISGDGLLIEPARTNLFLQSQNFANSSWSKVNCAVTSDVATAPDGTVTADKIVGSTSAGVQRVEQAIPCGIGARQAISIFAKAIPGETRWIFFRLKEANAPSLWFDLEQGVIGSSESGWLDAKIEALAENWFRLRGSFVATETLHTMRIGPADNGTTTVFTGNGSNGILVWGAQWEAAPDSSSYVFTTAAAATRSADEAVLAFVPGPFGYIFTEFVNPTIPPATTVTVVGADTGTPIYVDNGAILTSNGSSTLASGATASSGEVLRVVLAWNIDGRMVCANGALTSDANGMGSLTSLTLGGLNSHILSLVAMNGVPLSNQDCLKITGGNAPLSATGLDLESNAAGSTTRKALRTSFEGHERAFVGQQGTNDFGPGSGIVGVQSGDGSGRLEMTFYQYGATLRTWGSQMLEYFLNDDPGGISNFSVRGNGAAGGARIDARDGTDSYSIALGALGSDRICLLASGSDATSPPLPQDMSFAHMRADGFYRFAIGTSDHGAGGTEIARIDEEGLRLKQRSTAPNPPPGYTVLWARDDGTVHKTSNVGGVISTSAL